MKGIGGSSAIIWIITAAFTAPAMLLTLGGCAARSPSSAPAASSATARASEDQAPREAVVAQTDPDRPKSEGAPGDGVRNVLSSERAPQAASAVARPAAQVRIALAPGVTVVRDARAAVHRVEVEAIVCLTAGWLEQVACSPGTREHEALFVIEAAAHVLHAALLAAGFESGAPGRWLYDEAQGFQFIPPSGSELRLLVRGVDEPDDAARPVNQWIVADGSDRTLPDEPFVFGGSVFVPRAGAPGERAGTPRAREEPDTQQQQTNDADLLYAADVTGSLIGLVTFGDEVIGYRRVFADRSDVMPQEWVARSAVVPPVGTRVMLVLTAFENVGDGAAADR